MTPFILMICLCVPVSVYLPVFPAGLSISLSLSGYLVICLPVSLSVKLSVQMLFMSTLCISAISRKLVFGHNF